MTATKNDELAFGLHHVAQHNSGHAQPRNEQFEDGAVGLGIEFVGVAGHDAAGAPADDGQDGFDNVPEQSLYQAHPYSYPDPSALTSSSPSRSQTASEAGMRTRSGRISKQRNDSPLSSIRDSNSRVSKSPRSKKKKGGNGVSRISGPLSELTKDSKIPVKDIDAWVNRSAEDRIEESNKRKGHIARPMNSFMLYRSAYAERTKDWCKQNNHQVVSSVAGESWPMESDELRDQFNEWARIDRDNHARAFPDYKFSPSKSKLGKRREYEDEEEDNVSFADPDGEYLPARRPAKMLRSGPQNSSYRSDSPYMVDQYAYHGAQDRYGQTWITAQQPRPLPVAMANPYDANYYHQPVPSNQYIVPMDEMRMRAVATPESLYHAEGPVGLPSQSNYEQQQWNHTTPAAYHPAQPVVSQRPQPLIYQDPTTAQYSYTMQPAALQFDNTYPSYSEQGQSTFADPWNLDPSLMGTSETDSFYKSALDSVDPFGN